jgi:hypothetical protein
VNATTDDAELTYLLRRTMRAVCDAAPEMPIERRTGQHRWTMAAAAIAVMGVAATGLVLRSGGTPPDLPPLDPNDSAPTLASFRQSLAEDRLLVEAQERMIRDCMGSAGQLYQLQNHRGDGLSEFDLDPLWELIGRTDLERASTIGYNAVPRSSTVPDPVDVDTNQAEWQQAFYGGIGDAIPQVVIVNPVTGGDPFGGLTTQTSGGCFGASQALLFQDQARFTSLSIYIANDLSRELAEDPLGDPRVAPAIRAWADCMVERGHDRYDTPFDPAREAATRQDDPSQPWNPTPDELQTAVDDVECKQSSGLLDTTRLLVDAYGREAAGTAIPLLQEYRTIIDGAVRRANAYLDGTLTGPWRSATSDTAPRNTRTCIWLPDDPATLDASPGEAREVVEYLEALEAQESLAEDSATITVPPWLVSKGRCVEGATPELITSTRAAAPQP